MYKIKNTVITKNEEERNALRRNASLVIYNELLHYIEHRNKNLGDTA